MSPGDEHAGHLQEGKFSKEKMDGSVEVGDKEVKDRGRREIKRLCVAEPNRKICQNHQNV